MNIPAIIGIAALASSPGAIYGIYHLSHSSVKKEIQEPPIKEEAKPVEAAPVLPSPKKPEVPNKQQPKPARPSPIPTITYNFPRLPSNLLENLREGTIGSKYTEFLLGDRKSLEWNGKLHTWKETYKDASHKQNLTKAFTPGKLADLTIEKLHTRCRRAYEKKSWSEGIDRHQKNQYWAMVKALCGNGREMPNDWGTDN